MVKTHVRRVVMERRVVLELLTDGYRRELEGSEHPVAIALMSGDHERLEIEQRWDECRTTVRVESGEGLSFCGPDVEVTS